MSEIPEDLMAKAQAVAVDIALGEFSPIDRERAADRIARALMAERESATLAERERVAGVAKTLSAFYDGAAVQCKEDGDRQHEERCLARVFTADEIADRAPSMTRMERRALRALALGKTVADQKVAEDHADGFGAGCLVIRAEGVEVG